MGVFAIGIEDPLPMAMDRLQHSHLSEDHRPPCSAARVTQCVAVCTFSVSRFYDKILDALLCCGRRVRPL
jgi:hypothetical protein